MFSARSLGAKSFGSMFSGVSKDSKSSSALKNKINMYRRMRQERKKREDDDTHSVISEARSQRSMVIDGGSLARGRHRGSRNQDSDAGDAAGSNFGNRAQQISPDLISLSSSKSITSRASHRSTRSAASTTSKKSRLSLKSIGSKKEREPERPQEFLNFGSYVAQGLDTAENQKNASDMLF